MERRSCIQERDHVDKSEGLTENPEHCYIEYWHLKRRPFENVPDPRFYFPSEKHETARQRVLFGIRRHKGAVMLTGGIGCGKTLLSRALIMILPRSQYDVALVANPALPTSEFFREILHQFGLDDTGSKVAMLHRLDDRLLGNARAGIDTVLVVDEAQAIRCDRVFEELRLLMNFQLNDRPLMTLVLLGQPELRARVARIPQINQRIAVRYHLEPYTPTETCAYIRARMTAAGVRREVFTKEAIGSIFETSGGVSRVINTLCDYCLLFGAMQRLRAIDASLVAEAARAL
jgi:general secretion pathway protein A